jgi:hypothetical protein
LIDFPLISIHFLHPYNLPHTENEYRFHLLGKYL